jgi:catechol 2,3-dioxygenase-like lactoylglutathione lyase family enzyme
MLPPLPAITQTGRMSQSSSPREQAIPILRVQDAAATARWYEQLGFQLTNVHRFEPGLPAFATIERGEVTFFLSEHTGDARPDTLVYLRLPGVHELAALFEVTPDDNPWGPDFEVSDPDGNRLRIGTPSWW